MPAAARVGDPTKHATVLTPPNPPGGSLNVFIGGRPAWRALADQHVCPLTTGNVPHAAGMVMQGSLTVSINGFPAARADDLILEAGVTTTIASGLLTVQIGG